MAALVLTDDQVTLVRVLILAILLLAAMFAALVSAIGAGTRAHQPVPVPELDVVAEDGTEECPRCGGAGTTDLTDDEDRVIAFDVTCSTCGGIGRVEAVWH
jgi:hypothetical protein